MSVSLPLLSPIVGLAEHLGVVDCTPPMSELV